MAIRIVTDSASDLPRELADQWNITVVPCNVVIDDVNYKDGVEIMPDEFFQRLASARRLPSTSQPTVADFQPVYQQLLDEGHQVISIHIARKLSGTVNSAEQAKASLGDAAPVEVIDSQLASVALSLVTLRAAQLASEAESYKEVAQQVRQGLPQTQCFVAVDTLEYLQKGGRIGKAQAFVGSMLSVKPILKVENGEVHPLERPRNLNRAARRVADLAREHAPFQQLGVIYSTEQQRAAELRDSLADLIPESEIITARFGPALGTYVGPRAFGLALTSAA
jgi:DegV family protein with EDD domain